ncbi:MAG TPA: hypothetical protein VII70_09775 [Steroidobacteraceae bacterium]
MSNAIPVGQMPLCVIVALPLGPRLAWTPFTASLATTLMIGVESAPTIAMPLSGLAEMAAAVSVIVSDVVAHSERLVVAHSWY